MYLKKKKISVVGAGLVGSLWSIFLKKQGREHIVVDKIICESSELDVPIKKEIPIISIKKEIPIKKEIIKKNKGSY